MVSNWAQLIIRQCYPVQIRSEKPVLVGPPEACTSPELLGGSHCAFTSPCSLRGGTEKVRPSFISLFSLHNGFLWEGLVRQSRRGVKEFPGSFESAPPFCRWWHVASAAAHGFTHWAQTAVGTAGAYWQMRTGPGWLGTVVRTAFALQELEMSYKIVH